MSGAKPTEGRVCSPGGETTSNRLRLLVVEDNPDVANVLRLFAARWGYHVRVYDRGEDALADCPGYRPQVAILDLALPGLDGFEVARRLRELLPGGPRLVLIAFTGDREAGFRDRARQHFDHYLVKPSDLAVLEPILAAAAELNPDRGVGR